MAKKTTSAGGYNPISVQQAINRDSRISASEGKKIHSLLKGWRGSKTGMNVISGKYSSDK